MVLGKRVSNVGFRRVTCVSMTPDTRAFDACFDDSSQESDYRVFPWLSEAQRVTNVHLYASTCESDGRRDVLGSRTRE